MLVGGEVELLLGELDLLRPRAELHVDRLQDVHDSSLVLGVVGEGLELRERLAVARVFLDDGVQLVDGGRLVVELGEQQPREGEPERRLLHGVGRPVDAPLIVIGEVAVAPQLSVQLGQSVERARVRRVDVQGSSVGLDRVLEPLELALLEPRDAVEQLDAARAGAIVEHAAHEIDALRVPLLLDEQLLDRREQLLALGLERARPPEPRERLVDLADRREDLAGALGELGGRVVVVVDLRKLRGVDLSELALRRRRSREPLELGPHGAVADIFVEQPGRRIHRGAEVLELLFLELRQPLQQLDALGGVIAHLEASLEGALHLGPRALLQVHGLEHLGCARAIFALGLLLRREHDLELRDGLGVRRVVGQRFLQLVEGAARVLELLARDARDLHAQAGGARLAGLLEHSLVEIDQILPALLLGVELLELAGDPRVDGDLEGRLEPLDRLLRVLELVAEQLALAQDELLALGLALGGLLALPQDVEQRLRVTLLLVERLEGHHRAALVGAGLERLLVVLDRQVGLLEALARELPDAEVDLQLDVAVEDVGSHLSVELGRIFPAARGGGEALERLALLGDAVVAGGLLEGPLRVRVRARWVPERPLGGRERLLQALDALGGAVGDLGLDVEHLEELLCVPVGLVQGVQHLGGVATRVGELEHLLERGARRRVGRLDRERLTVRLEGAVEVRQVLAPHVAEPAIERDLVCRLVGEREVGVDDLSEVLVALGLLVQARERGVSSAIGAEGLEHGSPGLGRFGDVADRTRQHLSGLDHRSLALVGVGGDLLALLEHADQLAVRPLGLVQTLQGAERLLVAAVVCEAQAPRVDRLRSIFEHRFVEIAETLEQRLARVDRLLQLDLDLERLCEGRVAPGVGLKARQRASRWSDDRHLVGIDGEDPAIDLLGPGRVPEGGLEQVGDEHEDLGADAWRLGVVGGGREHGLHALVLVDALADLDEALADPVVVGDQRDQLGERLEGPGVVVEALVLQLADAAEQGLPLFGLAFLGGGRVLRALSRRAQGVEADLEHADEAPDLIPRFVDVLEQGCGPQPQAADVQHALGELARVGVVVPRAEDLLDVSERAIGDEQLLEVQAAEVEPDVDGLLVDRRLESALEQRGEVAVALLVLVQLLEGVERAHVGRIDGEDPLVVADRLLRRADDLLGDQRDLVEQGDLLDGVLGALGCLVEELLELTPALRAGEDLLETLEGLLVRRVHREDALQVRQRAVGVAQLLVVEGRRAIAELELDLA